MTVTDANTYTFVDSRSNTTGSGEVFGRRNIIIRGTGTVNYNLIVNNPRSTQDTHAIVMLGASDWLIEEITIRDQSKYGVYAQGVANWVANIKCFSASNVGAAAFQCNGKSRNGKFSGYGATSDTFVALICSDYPTLTYLISTDEGGVSFYNTIIENVFSDGSSLDIIRMAGCVGSWFYNTRIHNVSGYLSTNGSNLLAISISVDSAIHSPGETNWDGLEIDGIAVDKTGTGHVTQVSVVARGSSISKGLVIKNIEFINPLEAADQQFISFGGDGVGTCNIDDVLIERIYHRAQTWQGIAVGLQGTGTIRTVRVTNMSLNIDNALKTNTWKSSCFSHIISNLLTVDRVILDNCSMKDTSSAGSKSDPWTILNPIKTFTITRQRSENCLSLGYWLGGGTTSVISFTNSEVVNNTTNYGVRFDGAAGSFTVGDLRASGTVPVDLARIGYSNTVMRVRSLGGLWDASGNIHVNVAAGSANLPDCNGPDLSCVPANTALVTGSVIKESSTAKVVTYNGSAWIPVGSGTVFVQTASSTVANTITETTLVTTGAGSVILPAGFFVAGRTINFKMYGTIASVLTPTLRIKAKLGAVVVIDTTAATLLTITGTNLFTTEGKITCRTTGATGTVFGQGLALYYTGVSGLAGISSPNTATSTIDTTVAQTLDITVQWGTASASNTITSTNLVLKGEI